MKRGCKLNVLIISGVLILILLTSFVSAGLTDWLKNLFEIKEKPLQGEVGELATLAGSTAPFTFVSWGDTKSGRASLTTLSNQAKALNPKFTIYLGDLCDSFSTSCIQGAWKTAINGGSNNGMFDISFPIRGNHDSGNNAGWQSIFDLAGTANRVGATNYNFMSGMEDIVYSFDYGNSHFVGLDALGDATTLSNSQLTWLDTDLTNAESRGLLHAFIYFHGPIYCVDGHCSCTTKICSSDRTNDRIINIINKHPIVSATFHGHEHLYAATYINNSRMPSSTHGFYQFVTGDAGAGPKPCDKPARTDYCMSGHGFTLVTVNNERVIVDFYRQGNTAIQYTAQIVKPLPFSCGDGTCNGQENCTSCPGDCPCPEICDGIDNNKNGVIDDGGSSLCSDGIDCTTDRCNGQAGCQHAENNSLCSNNLFCDGIERCSIANRSCMPGTPVNCADNFSCTNDSCSEENNTCLNIQDDRRCPGGQVCRTSYFNGSGCGFIENCVDSDLDMKLDYNSSTCRNGEDLCPYTDINYFNRNPLKITQYVPNPRFNISEINKDNVFDYPEFTIRLNDSTEIIFRQNIRFIKINSSGCFQGVDLNKHVVIEYKKVSINASELNKPAKIKFLRINFTRPVIYKDNAICSACNITNYTKGIMLEVEVPGFSTYEAVEGAMCNDGACQPEIGENCTTCSYDCGECQVPRQNITINETEIPINITQGECEENWVCESYGECIDGEETRECTDENYCGTMKDIPDLERSCDETPAKTTIGTLSYIIYYTIIGVIIIFLIILGIILIKFFKKPKKPKTINSNLQAKHFRNPFLHRNSV